MTINETEKTISILKSLYINDFKKVQPKDYTDIVHNWKNALSECKFEDVKSAIYDVSKYMGKVPTIADIRHQMNQNNISYLE